MIIFIYTSCIIISNKKINNNNYLTQEQKILIKGQKNRKLNVLNQG